MYIKCCDFSQVSLSYDDHGRLLSVRDTDDPDHDVLYAASTSSVLVLMSPDGLAAREFRWTPYGEELETTSSSSSSSSGFLESTVGFAGGIPDQEAGIIHMQVHIRKGPDDEPTSKLNALIFYAFFERY